MPVLGRGGCFTPFLQGDAGGRRSDQRGWAAVILQRGRPEMPPIWRSKGSTMALPGCTKTSWAHSPKSEGRHKMALSGDM
eukprot:7021917-Alexandrium_andersonii.AAC.1